MQGEDDETGADRVGHGVEHVGMAAGNVDLVDFVGDARRHDEGPREEGRVAAEAGPQERGEAPEGDRVHELVPREALQALHRRGLAQHEELDQEGGDGDDAGGLDPGRQGGHAHG